MKFRILGDTLISSNSTYRGLYREEPQYCTENELYLLWDWYATEAGDGGYVTDEIKAFKLIETYAKTGKDFEIIRIEDEELNTSDGFLGIDICTKGGYSLLASGLKHSNDNDTKIEGIFELIEKYFQKKLNIHSLFEKKEDSTLFLKVIREIQQILPELIEEDVFQAYYLYEVCKK